MAAALKKYTELAPYIVRTINKHHYNVVDRNTGNSSYNKLEHWAAEKVCEQMNLEWTSERVIKEIAPSLVNNMFGIKSDV
jgi:hypothetical protein